MKGSLLVTWLCAQLDDDERVARGATPGPWRHDPTKHWRKPGTSWFEEAVFSGPRGADAVCVAGTGETDDPQSMADADHIASHDPARVLAVVARDRRILDEHQHGQNPYKPEEIACYTCHADGHETYYAVNNWCRTLRLLALPYADRPGYRPEWAPDA